MDQTQLRLEEVKTKHPTSLQAHRKGVRVNKTLEAKTGFTPLQPFLKWAGGKRALLPELRARTPEYSGTYIEPFLGAGALFFDQDPTRLKIVSDFNRDLVDVYLTIKNDLQSLLRELNSHENSADHYYAVRAWDREQEWEELSPVKKAARFIFLNKTNYNGLYRVNSSGQMNVPFGGQRRPDWIQAPLLEAINEFLNFKNINGIETTKIMCANYSEITALAKQGDWVYLDPPYAGTFTDYQSGGFSDDDQTLVRDEALRLTEIGVPVLLSNSDVKLIHDLYGDKKHRKYFKVEPVEVKRYIGANIASRGSTTEVMISNYRYLGIKV